MMTVAVRDGGGVMTVCDEWGGVMTVRDGGRDDDSGGEGWGGGDDSGSEGWGGGDDSVR